MKAATWTFGLWALLLPLSAGLIINKVDEMADSQSLIAEQFVAYREMMEKRVTILEERQIAIIKKLEQIDGDHRQEHRPNNRVYPERN